MKAIALLSGGLDSILAVKIILEQGIEVEGVYCVSVFSGKGDNEDTSILPAKAASQLGIDLKIFDISEELLAIVKSPARGYGANINPCIDCHAFMFKRAGEYMRQSGASFLITGEVLGERPMSQRKDALKIVDKDSGLEGLILRPLSAKLLELTIPEQSGWVNRANLFAIQGRSRKAQIELAKQFGITQYPNPASGCLLTDPIFAARMKDLMRYNPAFGIYDAKLLKLGRHFRLTPQAKLIVGRDETENNKLSDLAQDESLLFYPLTANGPLGISRGIFSENNILDTCRIIARYSDKEQGSQVDIAYKAAHNSVEKSIRVLPIEENMLNSLRI